MARVPATGRVPVSGRTLVSGRAALVEYQNKLTDSRNPAGGSWGAFGLSARTGNFGLNPFGSATDSVQLNESAVGGAHSAVETTTIFVLTETGWYCTSSWFKPGTRNFGGFLLDVGPCQFGAFFNLTTGALTFSGVFAGATSLFNTSSFKTGSWPTPSVAGWRRQFLAFEVLQVPALVGFMQYNMSDTGGAGSNNYVGAVGQTIEIWNPQFVKSNWPGPVQQTSPAPVNSASAIRLLAENA